MAEAILSVVAERFISIIEGKIWEEVNLVRGFDKKVDKLSKKLKETRQMLDDAEKQKSASDWKSVNDSLKKLEDTSYELEDVLDEWYTTLRKFQIQEMHQQQNSKVCNCTPFISCLCFHKLAARRGIAEKLQNVKQKILAEKDEYIFVTTAAPHSSTSNGRVQSTSIVDMEKIYGRAAEKNDLVRRVTSLGTDQLEILSVVGVGGLGKTTLAQLVFDDSRVTKCFEKRIWICVSNPFDEVKVAKAIIKSVTKKSSDSDQWDDLLKSIRDCISGKKFLLVMDDVWTDESSKWEPLITCLKIGSIGSKVLVTTRNEMVAKNIGTLEDGIYRLGVLSDENCWLLLQHISLLGRDKSEWNKFESVGKNIAKKCKGMPLAAKALGSLLYLKNSLEEWKDVHKSEIWELEKPKDDIFPILYLSYNELAPTVKRCFSYCAVFPKDTSINVQELIEQWMALGYLGSDGSGTGDMERRGREYFDNLAMRSLFQDIEKNDLDGKIEHCKMHDIVRDFAQLFRKNEDEEARIKNPSECEACSASLVSRAKEYRSLYFGNGELDWPGCRCLANLRVVSFREFGKQGIPHEIEKFIHLRWLDLSYNNLAAKDLETICMLYNLQTLLLRRCNLEELPREIGYLIHLRHLNLSRNRSLKELPESVCDLHELQRLNIDYCQSICRLPQGFHRLKNLKHLNNVSTISLKEFPQGLAQLTNLRTLSEFHAGSGRGKLGWLKDLNCLSGSLTLDLKLSGSENVDEDAKEGELMKKDCIQELVIKFDGNIDGDQEWVSLLDALEPHLHLLKLQIYYYGGSKLPSWMVSPLNRIKFIRLDGFSELSSLPPLGRLPSLEEIVIHNFQKMQVVGPEFFGAIEGSNSATAFPKLKRLTFEWCDNWREWSATEEDCKAVSYMPCLTELIVIGCSSLTVLPHRLLASPLEKLDIRYSTQLEIHYGDMLIHVERDDLVRRVISGMLQQGDQANHPQILSVVGVGGAGKTTLAQLVYNDNRVRECFGEFRIWISVSDPFDEVRTAKNIIESVVGRTPDSNQLEVLLQRLKECISGKKFLLVMDDVWTDDSSKWKPLITSLKNGSIGSKILVTTRNKMVAKLMGSLEDEIYSLGVLSNENCWLLLQRIALFGRDGGEWKRFESIGMKIANRCNGVPLAVKALGSILRTKNCLKEWEDVLNSEIWELMRSAYDFFPRLFLSYTELSPTLKLCFSYCGVFPQDTRINVQELIEHWMALGYLGSDDSGTDEMECHGREYFHNLAVRSLFQDFEYLNGQVEYCKMHNIVHDFARFLRKNEYWGSK